MISYGASSRASWRQWDSSEALAADTAPYEGMTRSPPELVMAYMRPPGPIRERRTRPWAQYTRECAMTVSVMSICSMVIEAAWSAATKGRSVPKASE